ncbi:SusC/RagA family TonB-linked outer membrane protein [Flavobacterium sp. DGU38]|uniref:SusC/RagA family TonB-linked outer membrane protein n=1 Tax=Flavobacterium calami TaxID=3139144 RepID=A0ABU9IQ24_9FLAO
MKIKLIVVVSHARKRLLMTIMKTFILLFCTTAFGFSSGNAFSQEKISIDKDKLVSVDEVFKIIKKQTKYLFLYPDDLFIDSPKVQLKKGKIDLNQLLNLSIPKSDFNFEVSKDHTILIKKKPKKLGSLDVQKKTRPISGIVTDYKGYVIPGVNVHVKGDSEFKVTDFDGSYTVLASTGDIIIFSYLGFITQEITVGDLDRYNVNMKEDVSNLDEVVLVGYGKTTQRYNTGSVSTLSKKDIERQPVSNVLKALEGTIPGVDVVNSGGYASSQVQITIRGKKDLYSQSSPSTPLYIIDGIPLITSNGDLNNAGVNQNSFFGSNGAQSPLYFINPQDIESISILKDGDATAIYGSRGANGVVLITTKKGKDEKATLTVSTFTGLQMRPKKTKMLNTQQYLEMRNEALSNDGIVPDASNAPDLFRWDNNRYTDWQDELASGSRTTDFQLSYAGGDQFNKFRFSGGFHSETPPIAKGFRNDFKDNRLSGLFTFNHASRDKRFNTSLMLNYAYTNTELPGASTYAFDIAPNAPRILDDKGKLNWSEWGAGEFGQDLMPYNFQSFFQPYESDTRNFMASYDLSYKIFDSLEVSSSFGYSTTDQGQIALVPASSQGSQPELYQNITQFGNNKFRGWIVEPKITYTTAISRGNLDVMAGITLQENITEGNTIQARGFVTEALMRDLRSGVIGDVGSNYAQFRFASYYGRLNYNWDGKYIVNLTARSDYSSRFKAGGQMGSFGSAGAAWIFTEEEFLKGGKFLSYGKLRGSYGTTGSAASGDYKYIELWESVNTYGGVPVLNLIQPYNENYSWQVNKKTDIGLELAFFDNAVNLNASWYKERSDDQLLDIPLAGFTGFSASTVPGNVPAAVENTGWEFSLSSFNINRENFKWRSNFNISINKNKVAAFPNLEDYPSYQYNYVVGKPTNVVFLLKSKGVNPDNGEYIFEDLNNDGVIDGNPGSQDMYAVDLTPEFYGGFQNTLEYKNLELSFLFSFKKHRGFYGISNNETPGTALVNQPVTVLDRWQKPGDITNVRAFTTINTLDNFLFLSSDGNLVDASYIRLQNLSLSYKIPQKNAGASPALDVNIFLRGQNLFTITSYKGEDPASPSRYVNGFPAQSIYTMGVNFSF